MMLNKCPVIGKVGLSINFVNLIQRSFCFMNILSKNRKNIAKRETKQRNLSNAGYHLTLRQVLKIIDT